MFSIGNMARNLPKKFSIGKLSLEGIGVNIPVVCADGSVALATSGDLASMGGAGSAMYNMSNSSGGNESNDGGSNTKKIKRGAVTDEEKEAILNDWSNNLSENSYTGGRSNEEIQSLADDPAHKGANRIIDIQKGMHEAEVGLDLERTGKLKDIVRDPTGKAEFFEDGGSGQKWDVKSFNSNFSPKKGGSTLDSAMDEIYGSLEEGEYVIVDVSQMSQEHISLLFEELEKQGLMNKIIKWP
ncbi:hypothetical protein [Clostridium sp.]|uniref:hypothetical protein n=1 Tax=Clostridium sp. TaxID=1506 RepID=UPI002608C9C9|nr:hypothetical protein [Clostridium sp.]